MWHACLSVITFSDWGKKSTFRDLCQKHHLILFLGCSLRFLVWLLCRGLQSHLLTEDQVEEPQQLVNLAIRCIRWLQKKGSLCICFWGISGELCDNILLMHFSFLLFVHMSMLFACHTCISHVSTAHNFIINWVTCLNIWCYPFLHFCTNKISSSMTWK